MSRILAFLLVLIPSFPVHAAEAPPGLALRTAAALYDGVRTEELANGLRIFLAPIPQSTAVTTHLVYKVGSADEEKTWTGLSHYLEHLMFKGTSRLKPGDIDRITFRAGGNNNAYTSTDITAYHFTLPARPDGAAWKAALAVESDRMRHLVIDKEHEFDKEKGAVINELTGNEDSPWDLEYKAILPMLFGRAHPYGHPVIGEEKHVRDATEKVIKGHYDRWYHPNNACLVMVGGFDPDAALAEIRKQFGSIPRGKLPARTALPSETPPLPSRREMPSKFSVARLLVGFPTIRIGEEDQPALDLLEILLGGGKRSRLYLSLVEGASVATSASADHSPGRYPGWFGVSVDLLPGQNRSSVEKLVLQELAKVREDLVPAEELARVKQQRIASAIFSRESTSGLADSIGRAVTLTSLDWARRYLPRIQEVTAADIQRVARKYLEPNRSATLWSVPPDKKSSGSGDRPEDGSGRRRLPRAKSTPAAFDLSRAQRVQLPNGLVVVLFPSRRLPIVEARALLRESSLYQPADKLGVASLTGTLLDEGTTTRSGGEIATLIENVGGSLSLSSSGGSVKVLSPNRQLGIGLLLDCLMHPTFPKDAFARARAQHLAALGESEVQADSRARRAYRALAYGKNPLGLPAAGTVASVKPLTPAACKDYHARVFVPNNTILAITGDFDPEEILTFVKQQTRDWKRVDLPRLGLPEITRPARFEQEIISMPDSAQLQVYLGHVGIRREDPDYYKLLVMDYILGTGPGFTDRLSSRLRDREGLAYSVSASITDSAGLQPGLFTCYIGTDTGNLDRVKQLFLEELRRIRDAKPTETEVADARTYLIGSRLLQFGTVGGIAGQLAAIERYGLGSNYLTEFQKAVAAVTAEDVQAVARKHLDPSRMVLVAAGAIGKDGKPLAKKE